MHVLLTYLQVGPWTHQGHHLACEAWDISAALTRVGIQVSIATIGPDIIIPQRNNGYPQRLSFSPLRIIPLSRLEEMWLAALLQSNLSLLAELISLWRNGAHFDVVHCLSWEAGSASQLICWLTGAALVWTIEDPVGQRTPWLSDRLGAYARYVERWMLHRCRHLICPDRYMFEKIQDIFLVEGEKVAVIPPPALGASSGGEEHIVKKGLDPVVLYAGPLNSACGLEDLLRACHHLVSGRVPYLKLLIYVSADFGQNLMIRRLIRELSLAEHVLWSGQKAPPTSGEEIFRQADLMVVPAEVEFVGNVILKAMQMDIPVVTIDGGALGEMLEDEVSCLMYPLGDQRSLSAAMEKALFDSALRQRIVSAARQKVRHPLWIGQRLQNIYQASCAGSRGPARKGGETDDDV